MIHRFFAASLIAAALPVAAQQAIPATNYTDLWDNSAAPGAGPCPGGESGWGITFTQHTSTQVEAVWYTYDPRQPDSTTPGNSKPLWLVMFSGPTGWTSPTVLSGDMYVTLGSPFGQPWAFGGTNPPLPITKVGTFTFTFANNNQGTFQYNVSPTAGVPSTDPAFGLPAFSGTKPICRNAGF